MSDAGHRDTLTLYTGEKDEEMAPMMKKKDRLPWWVFNSDFYSTDRSFAEVKDIVVKYSQQRIDLRPYMIWQPYVV